MVSDLIQEELDAGIPLSRIVVGGFSQGARSPSTPGSSTMGSLRAYAMSGYLPKDHAFELSEAAKKTPVAHFHGTDDPTVKIEWARQSRRSSPQWDSRLTDYSSTRAWVTARARKSLQTSKSGFRRCCHSGHTRGTLPRFLSNRSFASSLSLSEISERERER